MIFLCTITILYSISVFSQGFKTDNTTGNLLDANGNNFIMKGINVPLSWYQTQVNGSIAALRTNTGSNCLRIVINAGYNGTTATPANVWQTAVQACIDNQMIPMIELHDWTGSTNTTNDFTNMANWYVTNAAYLKQANIAKHILINICNEWGTWQTANSNGTAWRDGFNQAVTIIRNAGINTTLVIDAVGYGQDINNASNIKAYAASMINADPQKNLLFSVHMYCEWKKGAGDIPGTLQWMRTNKIPFIVGEFGYQHATDGSCDIDEQLIMDECQAKGIGWLAWSQKGNSSEVAYLDLCGDWDCRASTLSAWGNTVINGTNGTKTAVTCSVFTNTAPTVSLTAPTNGASFAALSSITVSATATDSDGTISKVEFYANNELIGTDNTSPYSISWTNAAAGTYSITAKAYDNSGTSTTSAARSITVTQPANNTLPSAVITQPHVNAYFQQNTNITIRVYSTDIGGTYANGTVSKVELYYAPTATPQNTTKLTTLTTHTQNTYTYVWENVPAGSYRITAKATDNLGATFTSAGVTITVGTAAFQAKGMAACKGKYLANIIASSVRSDFGTYWNGVTAENGCKWGSVEGTRNTMNWSQADISYNYANTNNLMFRYHAFAWGSQYPSWITSLNTTDFKAEMEQYIAAIAARYPNIDQIDVLNENMYINTYNGQEHAAGTPYFRAGLGGPGVTGYDWVIWLFEKARQYFPNAKLVMNDYELENNTAGINEMLAVVKVLRDRGLIDGFGTQAHCFNVDGLASNPTLLKNSLDLMATSGIPVYVTELDLNGGTTVSEATQLNSYQKLFPVYWEHPAVGGVTLWGYVEGSTWKTGTGLLNADGTIRSAMTWLQSYIAGKTDVGYPFCPSTTAPPPTNNLTNGEFDNGTTGWDMQYNNSATGTFTVITNANLSGTNAAKICPINAGTANWHIQLRQNAPFTAGKTYEISFMAKADAARTMDAGLQMEGDPWTSHWGAQQNLTTANQTFNYTFSPTVTDATAKLKFYVGNNTSCVYIDNVIFREQGAAVAPPATITPAGPTTFCTGGSVVLQANTGVGYTYQWRRDATNITGATSASYTATQSGTYTVIVTANSLSTTSSGVAVTVNAIPAAPTITNTTPTLCAGGTISLSIPTTTGATYAWTGPSSYTATTASISRSNATTAMGGTYSATVTVNGCTSTASTTTVTINAIPAAPTITNPTPTLCAGGTISLSIPTTTGATYAWTGPSSYTATTAAISRTNATTAMGGTYSTTVTVNGCTSTASTTTVTVNAIPAAPTVTSPITYQQNATATQLTATGTGLKWYTVATGGTGNTTAPTPSTATIGTSTHYVSQTVSGCESPRSAIQINIVAATIIQNITLSQGWNMISIHVHPSDSLFATIFNGLPVQTVKNANGFWRSGGTIQLNSITKIIPGEGYLVYMNSAATLQVSGIAMQTNNFASLKTGWNLIGCPFQTSTAFSTYFNATNTEIIKDTEGFWEPNNALSTIQNLIPGKGYYIKKK